MIKNLCIYAILLLFTINCSGQKNVNNQRIKNKKNMNFRTFDISKYRSIPQSGDGRTYAKGENGLVIAMTHESDSNGRTTQYREDCSYPYSPYTYSYEYDAKGYLLKSWVTFYDNMQVGKMIEYNRYGFKIKETDFDAPYKFSVDSLVDKMKKDYHIDLMDKQKVFSVNRFERKDLRTTFYEIIVYGDNWAHKIFYYIDGSTGKLLFKTERVFGDEGMKGQELPFDEYLRKRGQK